MSGNQTASGAAATAIILAAGRSTRMKTALPKVLHPVCGRPMLAYVLDACRRAGIERLCVVVGYGKEQVTAAFARDRGIYWVEQPEQKGTGHAVLMCEPLLRGFEGDVVVIAGDMPLVRPATIVRLLETHRATHAAVTLATCVLDEPRGYGRIIRDAQGRLRGIVEERDCTDSQRAIREVNPSYYCFAAPKLFAALPRLDNRNAKGEFYLTDVVGLLIDAGERGEAVTAVPPQDAIGVNSRKELAEINDLMRRRIIEAWMDAGVTVVDPATTWIDARAQIGEDTVIEPFAYVGADVVIGCRCRVGPFAHLPPGARLADGAAWPGGGNARPVVESAA